MIEDNLSERKKTILFGAVEDYIKNASPITSTGVQQKQQSKVSTATLRNELSTLEAMGYLKQVYTSGGRTPTTKAYRLYVNELMKSTSIDSEKLDKVNSLFLKRTDSLNEIVSSLASTISELTNYPSVVMLNGYNNLIIDKINIFKMVDGSGLLLIGTQTGVIQNNLKLSHDVTEQNCLDASHFLSLHFKGKSIADMTRHIKEYQKELTKEIVSYKSIFTSVINCLTNLSSQISSKGATKLLNSPDYTTVNELKKVFEFLDNPDEIKKVFENVDSSQNVSFSIGEEINHKDLENCAIIKADYKIGDENIVSIGVIGPERMDYNRIASSLKFIIDEISILNQISAPDENKGK